MEKTKISKIGYLNRKCKGLPKEEVMICIIMEDIDGEHTYNCSWHPFNESEYNENNMPAEGYLGTARVVSGKYKGIGFHAWKQNNQEFIYYKIL